MNQKKILWFGLWFGLILSLVMSGCGGGKGSTPLTLIVGGNGDLTITEVSSSYYASIPSFIEVNNSSTRPIQLSDYKLRTYAVLRESPYTLGTTPTVFTLPDMVISSGSYVIIGGKTVDEYNNGESVVYTYDSVNNTMPYWNANGFVELVKNDVTIDFVRFGTDSTVPLTSAQWKGGSAPTLPYSATTYGFSIALNGNNTDTNSASDWSTHNFATMGGPNDVTSDTDSDQDGIPDSCEVPRSTFAGLPLYNWGARVGPRDIFIHIDYMNSSDPGVIPRKEALDMIVAAFAAHNIAIHFDVGTLYSHFQYNLDNRSHQDPYSKYISVIDESGSGWVYNYKSLYMPLAKKQIFHYMLMGDQQPGDYMGSSGIAELPGNDFVVTLGHWELKTDTLADLNELINFQAGTIMHEFGHNLGLRHGGSDHENYKPNYYSIMNYLYQLSGLPVIGNSEGDRYYYWRRFYLGETAYASYLPNGGASLINGPQTSNMSINYSGGNGGIINEVSVAETQGLRQSGSTGVDFNGNGSAADTLTNHDLNDNASIETLSDFDDWANANLFFTRIYCGNLSYKIKSSTVNLKIVKNPIGDDQQDVIIETLYRQPKIGGK